MPWERPESRLRDARGDGRPAQGPCPRSEAYGAGGAVLGCRVGVLALLRGPVHLLQVPKLDGGQPDICREQELALPGPRPCRPAPWQRGPSSQSPQVGLGAPTGTPPASPSSPAWDTPGVLKRLEEAAGAGSAMDGRLVCQGQLEAWAGPVPPDWTTLWGVGLAAQGTAREVAWSHICNATSCASDSSMEEAGAVSREAGGPGPVQSSVDNKGPDWRSAARTDPRGRLACQG